MKKIIIEEKDGIFPLSEILSAITNGKAGETTEIEVRYKRGSSRNKDNIVFMVIGYLLRSIKGIDILLYANDNIKSMETTCGRIHVGNPIYTARGIAADILIIAEPVFDETKAILTETVTRSQIGAIITL